MYIPAVLAIFTLFGVFAILGTLAYGGFSAAPWVPLMRKQLVQVLAAGELSPGQVIFDLGCGDGRLLAGAAGNYKAEAVGFEIALLPYIFAKLRGWLTPGVKYTVKYKSFWGIDLGGADVIFCFLMPHSLRRLEVKAKKEMRPGSKLVSYAFSFPQLEPSRVLRQEGIAPIYVYKF